MREEIIQTYKGKIFTLNKTYEARKEYFENKMDEQLDSVDSFEKNKSRRKRKLKEIDGKIEECQDPRKTKMVIEFIDQDSASIKSFVAKKPSSIKVTTRFMCGKLLMFEKLSLRSFIYEIAETFCFLDENVKQILKKYGIEKVEVFHVLTDTDSTSLKFTFVSDPNSKTPEDKFREIMFEVIIASKICKRFDSSHVFCDIFGAEKENKKKKLGYYEIEHIDNPCILTLAVILKEYLELFEDKNTNKKHKDIKKGSSGLGSENFFTKNKIFSKFLYL